MCRKDHDMICHSLLSLFLLSSLSFGARSVEDVRSELQASLERGNCSVSLVLAREVLAKVPDDLPALKAIEQCTRKDLTSSYGEKAKEVLESSKILSIVPEFLAMAKVKDLVPILKDVETKNLTVTDYLALTELYQKLGEPEKELQMLEEAFSAAPDDPRIKLILARSQFASGNKKAARASFREYLKKSNEHSDRFYFGIYVAAMAYPFYILPALLLLTWGLGWALKKYFETGWVKTEETVNGPARKLILFCGVLFPVFLALEFNSTGSALPFGILISILFAESALLVGVPLWRKWISKLWNRALRFVSTVFNGVRFARRIASLSTGWRVVLSLGSLIVLGTIAPVIQMPDLRYAVSAMALLVFYGTVGSLIVTVLRSSPSLKNSMRWIAISATLPFILSYVISHWEDIGQPFVFARLPTAHAVQGLVNYSLFWGVSVFLALHLNKILADALIEPMREIMSKVKMIETGDFAARTVASSNDELGTLARAVNHMAEGLQRREFIEKTFSRYVDEKIAKRILGGSEDEINIAGQKMNATVLFSDIRGFTTLSEQLPPEEVVQVLNTYFSKMVATVKSHGGVIDKFIGDAMLCVWGVPHPVENGTLQAVRCALEMQKEMKVLNEEFSARGLPSLGVGIGINVGSVVAGSLGSSDRMEYTVIGDVVNTAQRVESKAPAGSVLLTDPTYQTFREAIEAESMGEFSLKGKAVPMTLWSVKRVKEKTEPLAA